MFQGTAMPSTDLEILSLLWSSEVNLATGIGDLALISDLQALAKEKEDDSNDRAFELVSALWAIRVALNVSLLYIVVGFGVTRGAVIVASLSVLFYGIQYSQLALLLEEKGLSLKEKPLLYALAYASVVNFFFGLPYRRGPGPYYLWMVQILVSFVAGALLLGYITTVPEIQEAYGCYSQRSFMDLGALGVCPDSPLGSTKICNLNVGAVPPSGNCKSLPWSKTIGVGVLRIARVLLSIGIGFYAATVEKNYSRLGKVEVEEDSESKNQ